MICEFPFVRVQEHDKSGTDSNAFGEKFKAKHVGRSRIPFPGPAEVPWKKALLPDFSIGSEDSRSPGFPRCLSGRATFGL